jgi:hypothetical protein
VKEEQGKPVEWKMRELEDCQNDLTDLAKAMIQTLEEQSAAGVPDLLYTLQRCLDFGVLFTSLCGERSMEGKIPVKRSDVSRSNRIQKMRFFHGQASTCSKIGEE